MNGAIAKIGDDVVYNRLILNLTARPILVACAQRGIKITSKMAGMHYSNFSVSDFWSELTNFVITDFSQHELDTEKIYSSAPTPEEKLFIENLIPDSLYSVMTHDYICETNDNDGIAKWLEDLLHHA